MDYISSKSMMYLLSLAAFLCITPIDLCTSASLSGYGLPSTISSLPLRSASANQGQYSTPEEQKYSGAPQTDQYAPPKPSTNVGAPTAYSPSTSASYRSTSEHEHSSPSDATTATGAVPITGADRSQGKVIRPLPNRLPSQSPSASASFTMDPSEFLKGQAYRVPSTAINGPAKTAFPPMNSGSFRSAPQSGPVSGYGSGAPRATIDPYMNGEPRAIIGANTNGQGYEQRGNAGAYTIGQGAAPRVTAGAYTDNQGAAPRATVGPYANGGEQYRSGFVAPGSESAGIGRVGAWSGSGSGAGRFG